MILSEEAVYLLVQSVSSVPQQQADHFLHFICTTEHMFIYQNTEYKTVCAIKFARSDLKHSYEQVSREEEYCNLLA